MEEKIYLAGGWFTDEQAKRIDEMESICDKYDIEYYSPRKHLLWKPGMDSLSVVNTNLLEISLCKFMVASTEGKDPGTLFECGAAHMMGIPIVYYYTGKGKFNIMLASTGRAVLTSYNQLESYMKEYSKKGVLRTIKYEGDME